MPQLFEFVVGMELPESGDDVGACYRVVIPYEKKTLSRNA